MLSISLSLHNLTLPFSHIALANVDYVMNESFKKVIKYSSSSKVLNEKWRIYRSLSTHFTSPYSQIQNWLIHDKQRGSESSRV